MSFILNPFSFFRRILAEAEKLRNWCFDHENYILVYIIIEFCGIAKSVLKSANNQKAAALFDRPKFENYHFGKKECHKVYLKF